MFIFYALLKDYYYYYTHFNIKCINYTLDRANNFKKGEKEIAFKITVLPCHALRASVFIYQRSSSLCDFTFFYLSFNFFFVGWLQKIQRPSTWEPRVLREMQPPYQYNLFSVFHMTWNTLRYCIAFFHTHTSIGWQNHKNRICLRKQHLIHKVNAYVLLKLFALTHFLLLLLLFYTFYTFYDYN